MGAVCPEYGVRTVESAEEALKLLSAQEFFMVITDARMGGMTGYELIKQIKARRLELPVLMITAYDTSQLAVEAIKSGAVDYLPKTLRTRAASPGHQLVCPRLSQEPGNRRSSRAHR